MAGMVVGGDEREVRERGISPEKRWKSSVDNTIARKVDKLQLITTTHSLLLEFLGHSRYPSP